MARTKVAAAKPVTAPETKIEQTADDRAYYAVRKFGWELARHQERTSSWADGFEHDPLRAFNQADGAIEHATSAAVWTFAIGEIWSAVALYNNLARDLGGNEPPSIKAESVERALTKVVAVAQSKMIHGARTVESWSGKMGNVVDRAMLAAWARLVETATEALSFVKGDA
jgi:hypothetical protein